MIFPQHRSISTPHQDLYSPSSLDPSISPSSILSTQFPPNLASSTSHATSSPNLHSSEAISEGYEQFLKDETSLSLVAFYIFTLTLSILVRTIHSFSPATCLSLLFTIPGYLYIYAIIQHEYKDYHLKPLPIRTIYIGNAVIILISFVTGLVLYNVSTEYCNGYLCDPKHTTGLQPNFLALAISNTVFTPFAIKVHTRGATGISVIVKIILLYASALRAKSNFGTYAAISTMIFFQGLLLWKYEYYTKRMFINKIQIEHQVRTTMAIENEKLVMEMNSKELKSLIGNVAHDLKSPLQAFTFELDTLLSKFQENATSSGIESVLLLKSISSFMVMLINRAIDYTKATSGIGLKPSFETFHLTETMEWVVRCAERCNRKISIHILPTPMNICRYIISDRQWLLENLLCLVSNAQKFTSKGEITIRCFLVTPTFPIGNETNLISCTHDALPPSDIPLLRFEVEDCGIGISDEKKKELFKPFMQAQRRAGGTGLGLYSLAKRMESLGGSCGVTDRIDGKQGARFWFSIPYRPDRMVESQNSDASNRSNRILPIDDPPDIERRVTPTSFTELKIGHFDTSRRTSDSIPFFESSPDSRSKSNSEIPTIVIPVKEIVTSKPTQPAPLPPSKIRVLLVEDSTLIQKTTIRALTREGYDVDLATNGMECLEMIEKSSYQIVLMDIQMPMMDGFEATTRLRELEKLKLNQLDKLNLNDSIYDIENGGAPISSTSSLIIIGLSANADSETKEMALAAGMNEFIPKPLSMEKLKLCLKRLHTPHSSFPDMDNGL